MTRQTCALLLLAQSLICMDAGAADRSSADYTISADAMAATGGVGVSGAVSSSGILTSGGENHGLAGDKDLRAGWTALLVRPSGLELSLGLDNRINELASGPLAATRVHDDQSREPLDANALTWQVLSGPISAISAGGILSASAVYQNTTASLRGELDGLVEALDIQIENVGNDNFGAYAGDKMADDWQVMNFGEDSPAAAGPADPDKDGQANLLEYRAGTEPDDATSLFRMNLTITPAGTREIQFAPWKPGRTYTLLGSTSLTSWAPVPGVIFSNQAGIGKAEHTPSSPPSKFFYLMGVAFPPP